MKKLRLLPIVFSTLFVLSGCKEEYNAPLHTCSHVCPICFKCTDLDCPDTTTCKDKCLGHEGIEVQLFARDQNVESIEVYTTRDLTSLDTNEKIYARNGSTGEVELSGEGEINFVIKCKEGYTVDFTYANDCRAYISKSNKKVTYSDIYKACPFDNLVYIIEAKGQQCVNELTSYSCLYNNNHPTVNTTTTYKIAALDYLAFHTNTYREYDYFYEKALEVNSDASLRGKIESITIWGTHDSVSWLKTSNNVGGSADGKTPQYPLIFDDNYQAKPAYWAFVDDSKLTPSIQEISITEKVDDAFTAGASYSFLCTK